MVDVGHSAPLVAKKACAMCGLHMMEAMSSGTSSDDEYAENVENFALEVVGQGCSGGLVYLFLEDWELARVALNCHPETFCVDKCKRFGSCGAARDTHCRSVLEVSPILEGRGR